MIMVGGEIPAAEVNAYADDDIKTMKLADYRGKWLIMLFYPADFTFVCPTELEEAAEHHSEIRKLGAEILSVSTDTAFVHKAWHDNSEAIKKIKYPMLADPGGKLCRTFGTYAEDEGHSLRATYIIDPDGVVKSVDMHDNSIGRSIKEIIRRLQAAKFVREHKGKVCPASWQPGEDVIEESTDMVGKI